MIRSRARYGAVACTFVAVALMAPEAHAATTPGASPLLRSLGALAPLISLLLAIRQLRKRKLTAWNARERAADERLDRAP